MNAKIKKYVVPNLPYLVIFWFFCKLGEAYRLAAGADFGAKLIGMMKTIGPTFGTVAPALVGFNLLVGLNRKFQSYTRAEVQGELQACLTHSIS